MEHMVLNFMSPPIPYFIGCGREHYAIGEKHINRYNLGCFDIVAVVKGKLYIGEESNKWEVGENEVLILRPDLYHYGVEDCREETSILWVHFNTVGVWAEHDSMADYMKNLQQLKNQHCIYDMPSSFISPISIPKYSRMSEKVLEYIKELARLQEEPRTIAAWAQQTTFQQLLQYLDCEQTLPQDLTAIHVAEMVVQFICDNYHRTITNPILKRELNFHPNYMARCMQKHYGVTPLEYLNHFRIDMSKKILLNTDYPIEKVAEEVGMEFSTFSNSFRKTEGVSPREYRKKYAKS